MTAITAIDEKVDHLADRMVELAHRSARDGGLMGKFAGTLEEEAHFLRKLKPSLIRARMHKQQAVTTDDTVTTKETATTDDAVTTDDTVTREAVTGDAQRFVAADTPPDLPPSVQETTPSPKDRVRSFTKRMRKAGGGTAGSGPNPWVVVGVCVTVGIVAARVIDWSARGDD